MALQVTTAEQTYQYNNNNGNSNNNNNNNNNNADNSADNYYNNNNYDADYAYTNNGFLDFKTCSDGVVQVTNVKIVCDSPYSYSYGNGAHRNSPLCDYGDKATVSVYFSVTKSLGYSDNIFIDMGVYAHKTDLELLWEQKAVELSTLVGHACTEKGTYAFATTATFEYYYTDKSEFYPYVEIAFSTAADQGSNLGGVNVQCNLDSFYDAWFAGKTTRSSKGSRVGKFFKNMFIFAAVLGVIGAGAYYVQQKYADNIEYQGTMEKINGYYSNMGWGESEGDTELQHQGDDDDSKSEDQSMHA
jgi:hypothetical protein